jgi:hypothetical protein
MASPALMGKLASEDVAEIEHPSQSVSSDLAPNRQVHYSRKEGSKAVMTLGEFSAARILVTRLLLPTR